MVEIHRKNVIIDMKITKSSTLYEMGMHGFDYLLLWHRPGAEYICFEPWAGICASNGGVTDITKKRVS